MINIVFCKYFECIINAIYLLLHNKNVPVTIVDYCKIDTNDEIYFIFNLQNIKLLPIKYVAFNFEQLLAINITPEFLHKLKSALFVIDYSQMNVEYLKTHNIKTKFLPYSWLPKMKTVKLIRDFDNRENTMMFIGLLNQRRIDCLRPVHTYCKTNNHKMFISNDCWDGYHTK